MYREELKKQVVAEYEAGASQSSLRKKYQIGGATTIGKWIARYGKDAKPNTDSSENVATQDTLTQELRDAKLQIVYLKTVIELAEQTYGIDLKKKFAGKPLTD